MTGKTHSDLDLSMLTDEEREGLLDDTVIDEGLEDDGSEGDDGAGDDGNDTGTDTGAADGNEDTGAGDSDDTETGGDNGQADGAAAAAAVPADAGAADADDTGGAGDDAAADEVERPASWILPPDINDKIKNLDEERDRIAAQFDDGDLTAQEMRAKLKPIEQELDALKDRRTAANVSRDLAIEAYKTQTVPAFFKEHTQYKKGTVLYDMLDAEVKKQQLGSLDPLNPKHLQKAHEIIDGQLRAALGDAAGKKEAPKTPAGKTPAPKREIPPTLANVPSADITDAEDGGEFAYLDRLANKDVEAYERELGKLSDDKRDRYLAQ